MKEAHKCPRCLEYTTEKYYCTHCVTVLRKPPFFPAMLARSHRPVAEESRYGTVYGRKEDTGRLR